jgi:hypothetical protein
MAKKRKEISKDGKLEKAVENMLRLCDDDNMPIRNEQEPRPL